MAEEKKDKKDIAKKGKKNQNDVSFLKRIQKTFKDMKGEMKKVVWPSKKQVINNSGIVIVVVLITGTAIGLVDFLLKLGVDLLLRMA